jgi:hypothetical protein
VFTKKYLTLAGFLIALAAIPAKAAQIDAVFFDNRFGTIDDATGAFTQISILPIAQAGGIAFNNGTLYAQDLKSNLIDIDPASGVASILGSAGVQLSSAGFAGGVNGLFEVDYASNLYSIDPASGAATFVGATGLAANNGGWDTSISDDGSFLYFTAGGAGAIDELYRIDPTTGKATDLGSTGVSGIAGSAIVSGYLELFQYHWNGDMNYIYSAALGSTNFGAEAGLGVQVVDGGVVLTSLTSQSFDGSLSTPEPLPVVLLGSGLFGLVLLRRKIAGTVK